MASNKTTTAPATPSSLLDFLTLISRGSLHRAPTTRRAQYPSARSNYKPILLLAIINRIEAFAPVFRDGIIRYAPCTEDFAHIYDTCYGPGASRPVQPKVTQAFWYLGAGKPKIWSLVPNDGMQAKLAVSLEEGEQVKEQTRLMELVSHAELPKQTLDLLKNPVGARATIAYLKQEFDLQDLGSQIDKTLTQLRSRF